MLQVGGMVSYGMDKLAADLTPGTAFDWICMADLPPEFLEVLPQLSSSPLPLAMLPAISVARLMQGPAFALNMPQLPSFLKDSIQEPWQSQNVAALMSLMANIESSCREAALRDPRQPAASVNQTMSEAADLASFLRLIAAQPSQMFALTATTLPSHCQAMHLAFARLFQSNKTALPALQDAAALAASSIPDFDQARSLQQTVKRVSGQCTADLNSLASVLQPSVGAMQAWQSANPILAALQIWQEGTAASAQPNDIAVGLSMLTALAGSSIPAEARSLLQAMQTNSAAAWDQLPAQLVNSSMSSAIDDFLQPSLATAWAALRSMLSDVLPTRQRHPLLVMSDAISSIRSEHLSPALIAKALTAPLAFLDRGRAALKAELVRVIKHPSYGVQETVSSSHRILAALVKDEALSKEALQVFMLVLHLVRDFLLAEAQAVTLSNVNARLQVHEALLGHLQTATLETQQRLTAHLCGAATAAIRSDLPGVLDQLGPLLYGKTQISMIRQLEAISAALRLTRQMTVSPAASLAQGCRLAAELVSDTGSQQVQDLQLLANAVPRDFVFASRLGTSVPWAAGQNACELMSAMNVALRQPHTAVGDRLELLLAHLRQAVSTSGLRAALCEASTTTDLLFLLVHALCIHCMLLC